MADFDMVIRGGTVVTAADTMRADVGIRAGKVVALADNLGEGAEEIDADGKLVLPGGIDSHCHIDQPSSMGATTADDFLSGSRSALCGGTTCIIPFAAQHKGQSLRAVVQDYHARAVDKAMIDYAFHLIISDPTEQVLGQELPALTRYLIAMSDFLRDYGLVLVIGLGAIAWLFSRMLRNPDNRRRFDRALLRLPIVGKLNRGFNTARFTRTLSILSGSGVPVLESLRISAQVITNLPMREAVDEAASRIREGAAIGKSLAVGGYFPPLCIHLISSGEASGELETMLDRAASNQEREMDGLIAALLGILEPGLIIGMGVIVLLIVLAILLPIFELNQLAA